MFENREQCMLAMSDALMRMGKAFDEYNAEDFDKALLSAVHSTSTAMFALAAFANDYPYSDDVYNRINDIRRALNILEHDIECYNLEVSGVE